MLYQSPADFCAEYANAHNHDKTDGFGAVSTLEEVTVVSETSDTARVEALWFAYGHDPDSGYYDVFERTAFVGAEDVVLGKEQGPSSADEKLEGRAVAGPGGRLVEQGPGPPWRECERGPGTGGVPIASTSRPPTSAIPATVSVQGGHCAAKPGRFAYSALVLTEPKHVCCHIGRLVVTDGSWAVVGATPEGSWRGYLSPTEFEEKHYADQATAERTNRKPVLPADQHLPQAGGTSGGWASLSCSRI
ncbi:hypothetical protein [Streptomyces phaeochromogenes]